MISQKKSKATRRMSSRQRPLHACGVSIIAIGDIAIGKTQNINGPLGSTLRNMSKLAKFVTPLIYAIQYQWLTILAFIDNRILAAENITEKLFPPSRYAFDKIDEIVLMILSSPDKIDGALNKYVPAIIHHVPLLEWTLKIVMSKLNCLDSNWGNENSSLNEKTIGVDRNCCNESELESGASEEYLNLPMDPSSVESFPPIPEAEPKGVVKTVSCSHNLKGSYKEALLESSEKKMDNDECQEKEIKSDECQEKAIKSDECQEKEIKSDEKSIEKECEIVEKVEKSETVPYDPLMELFESAWLMNPGSFWDKAEKERD